MDTTSPSNDRLADVIRSRRKPEAPLNPLPFPVEGPLVPVSEDRAEAGRAFQAARKALGLTAKAMGALLRVNVRTIEKWEQGGGHVDASAWALLQVAARITSVRTLLTQ